MGQAKDQQIRDEEQHIRHLAKCDLCGAPVETAGDKICSRCQHNLDKDD